MNKILRNFQIHKIRNKMTQNFPSIQYHVTEREREREGGRGEKGEEGTYMMVLKLLSSSKHSHTDHQTMIKTVTTVERGEHNSQSWSHVSL